MGGLLRGYKRHLTPVSPGAARTDPLDRGLIGEWRFDPISGLVVPDYSGYGTHCDLLDTPVWENTEYGPAVNFNGADRTGNVDAVGGLLDTHVGTVESFAALDSTPPSTADYIFAARSSGVANRIHTFVSSSLPGEPAVGIGDVTTLATGVVPAAGTFFHLVLTWDNGSATTYLDGLFNRQDAYTDFAVQPSNVEIGNYAFSDPRHFEGPIALIRVYNRVLTAAEISARYEMCLKRAQAMTHVWMMPQGRAPVAGILGERGTLRGVLRGAHRGI